MTIPISEYVDVTVSLTDAAVDAFGFGALLGVFNLVQAEGARSFGPYNDLAEAVAGGFTAALEPNANAWLQAVFAQGTHIENVYIADKFVADASWTATLDAAETAVGSSNFYFLNVETRTEADILLAAAWAETHNTADSPKLYIAQSQDAAFPAGTAGNIALDLEAAGYVRTGIYYHRFSDYNDGAVASDGFLDGAITSRAGGFNLDAPSGAGVWYHKALSGITADPLTSAQRTAIKDAGGNWYGATGSLSLTGHGTVATSRFIDVTTSLDWVRTRIGEAVMAAFAGEPNKSPYTNGGINRIKSVVVGVLEQGVTYGHISPDFPRTIVAPKVGDVSSADKLIRKLTLTGNFVLAGGIYSVTLPITVQQ